MKAPNISYLRPKSLTEALRAFGGERDARLLAGGQSLLPMLNLRLVRPEVLIDISRLAELSFIRESADSWTIGSGVTHSELEDGGSIFDRCPMIPEVAAGIAYRSVRNLGTIGGAVAHADPAADWPLVLAALDARVVLQNSRRERRTRAAAEFTTGPFTTDIREHELIEAIEIPKPSPEFKCGYFKFCRKAGDFPEASAFVAFDAARQHARAYLGALDGPPMAFPELAREALACGRALPLEAIAPAVKRALSHIDHVRLAMYVGVMRRAFERAIL